MNINNKIYWLQDLADTEKLFIMTGLKDNEDGNTFSHDEVMEDIRKTYCM